MQPKIASFEAYMQQGDEALGRGDMFDDAAVVFGRAAMVASIDRNVSNEARAFQMMSVAYSLDGQPEMAERFAGKALGLAKDDDALAGRILRDAGMALLRQAIHLPDCEQRDKLLTDADENFSTSYMLLTRFPDNSLEAAVTLGFMGRHRLIVGENKTAREYLIDADKVLRDGPNRDYELNNLMWLLRAKVPYWERRAYRKARIIPLIEETGQTRRHDELRLIVIGGDRLYRFVERNRWIQDLVRQLRGK